MIDEIYINEARRIRKDYLTNLIRIVEKEKDMKQYLSIIETIKDELNENDNKNDDNIYNSKVTELNKNIEKLKTYILEYDDNIQLLNKAQKILYNNIKEKHINITDDEMQVEIMSKIQDLDDKFKKQHEKTLSKFDIK